LADLDAEVQREQDQIKHWHISSLNARMAMMLAMVMMRSWTYTPRSSREPPSPHT
jgi:hypothetical protein